MDRFTTTALPRPPSFNEADVSDKPPFLRRPVLDDATLARMQLRYQCALASLQEVDRGVKKIYDAFRRLNELRRTVFIFTSDNGFFNGEHRFGAGKLLAYGESIGVPLVIRIPSAYRRGAPRVGKVSEPVVNIDLVPTILDLAEAEPCRADDRCRVLDGRSLVGLLRGDSSGWPSDRGIFLEYKDLSAPSLSLCAYTGIRTSDRTYIEYTSAASPTTHGCGTTDARELYELGSDPFELENVADAPAHRAEVRRLSRRLALLRDCAGIAGRDQRVDGRPFCE